VRLQSTTLYAAKHSGRQTGIAPDLPPTSHFFINARLPSFFESHSSFLDRKEFHVCKANFVDVGAGACVREHL
jgi:hypothetical protein